MGERKPNAVSSRMKIMQVLEQHPQGLNSTKLRSLVSSSYAVSDQHLAKELQRLAKEGKIHNVGRRECPSCALRSVVYQTIRDKRHA